MKSLSKGIFEADWQIRGDRNKYSQMVLTNNILVGHWQWTQGSHAWHSCLIREIGTCAS